MSEADGGGVAVKIEPVRQHSVTFWMTDGNGGAGWQNGAWRGSAGESKSYHWIPPCGKNCTNWHSSILAEHL